MRIRTLFPLLLLAGCATGPSLAVRASGYVGAPEQSLIQAWGVPDKQIAVSGASYLVYEQRVVQDVGPDFYGPPFWHPFYGPGWGPDVVVWACDVTFTVKDEKVTQVVLRGNDCN